MDISMPSDFPMADFRAFGLATQKFFPKLLSDEDLNDPQERLRHFQWSWQAVRYRYRLCFDSSEEFSVLLDNADESWQKGGTDEELSYKLERCIYVFFVSSVSVFDSLGFCLYFFGNTLRSTNFPYVVTPKKITLNATTKGFAASFPNANITQRLTELSKEREFVALEDRRNILAHRLSGRRSVRSRGTVRLDGTYESTSEEGWYMPGSDELTFEEGMLRGTLQAITALLVPLVTHRANLPSGNRQLVRFVCTPLLSTLELSNTSGSRFQARCKSASSCNWRSRTHGL